MANYYLPSGIKIEEEAQCFSSTTPNIIPVQCFGDNTEADIWYLSDFNFNSSDDPEPMFIKGGRNKNTWGEITTTWKTDTGEEIRNPYTYNGAPLPMVTDKKTVPSPIIEHIGTGSTNYGVFFPDPTDKSHVITTLNGNIRYLCTVGDIYAGVTASHNVTVKIAYQKVSIYYDSESKCVVYQREGKTVNSSGVIGEMLSKDKEKQFIGVGSPYIYLYVQAAGGCSGVSMREGWTESNTACEAIAFGGGGGSGAFGILSVNISKFSSDNPLVIETHPYNSTNATSDTGDLCIYAGSTLILTLGRGGEGNNGYYKSEGNFKNAANYYGGTGGQGGEASRSVSDIKDTICVVDAMNGANGSTGGVARYPTQWFESTSPSAKNDIRDHYIRLFDDSACKCMTTLSTSSFGGSQSQQDPNAKYSGFGGCSIMGNPCGTRDIGAGAYSSTPKASNSSSYTANNGGNSGIWICYANLYS